MNAARSTELAMIGLYGLIYSPKETPAFKPKRNLVSDNRLNARPPDQDL
jgi:hypothetical protein